MTKRYLRGMDRVTYTVLLFLAMYLLFSPDSFQHMSHTY